MYSIKGFKKIQAYKGWKPYIKRTCMSITGGAWHIVAFEGHPEIECKMSIRNYNKYVAELSQY